MRTEASTWMKDELARLAETDGLYVRASNGTGSRWYQAARVHTSCP